MATITITIPDEVLERVLDGICGSYGYQEEIEGLPNPESKAQFARRMNREWIKKCVRQYEGLMAYNSAYSVVVNDRIAAENAVDDEIILS